MLAVIANGDDAFRLVDVTGRDVGWVRSTTIGFGGFVSESAAHGAAIEGARTLGRCMKQEFGVTHLELSERPRARTIRDGENEWVADGKIRIARLLRIANDETGGTELALEFQLPRYANAAVAINAALIVYGTLTSELVATSGSTSSTRRKARSPVAWHLPHTESEIPHGTLGRQASTSKRE